MQGHLAVRAPVLEREYSTALTSVDDDGFFGETPSQRPAHFQFVRPRHRIPIVRMSTNTAQIEGIGRIRWVQGNQLRAIVGHRALPIHVLNGKNNPDDANSEVHAGPLTPRQSGSGQRTVLYNTIGFTAMARDLHDGKGESPYQFA